MNSRNRRFIASGVTALSLAAAVGGVASAQSTAPPPATSQPADTTAADAGEQDPTLNGSIQATENESASETDESAALAQMSGLISEQDAIAAATADGGTSNSVSLENDNGSVIWEVAVTNADGTFNEVKVDAGNGTVLARESDDGAEETGADDANEGKEGNEANEANEAPETNGTAPTNG